MNRLMNLTLALAIGCAMAAAGALLDGPSDIDTAQALASDLEAAELAGQRFARDLRECKRHVGPAADLIEIAGTNDFVCRDMTIEPTPAKILRSYALTGSGK
jgi:hypothetical protein